MLSPLGGARSLGPLGVGRRRAGASFDEDAEALFARMTTEPDDTRKALISDTIVALKNASLWTQLDALWFLAAHDSQAGTRNWLADEFNPTIVNAMSFTADRGFTGDGSTTYLDTGLAPSAGTQYTLNDASYGIYCRTTTAEISWDMGATTGSNPRANIATQILTEALRGFVNEASHGGNHTVSGDPGMFAVDRSGASAGNVYENGASVSTFSTSSTSRPTPAWYIGGQNNGGSPANLSTKQYAFAYVGASLTPTQHSDLATIVEAYLDAIGAGVVT